MHGSCEHVLRLWLIRVWYCGQTSSCTVCQEPLPANDLRPQTRQGILGEYAGQGLMHYAALAWFPVCLEAASPTVKQAAKEEMWSGSNSMIGTGGKAMRYPQQQEIMDMVRLAGT
eukprot:scaffold72249_cov20-Tisochrysis_lutea.AAC.2